MKTGISYHEITPRESVPLSGYGDRTHNSEGIHDPLYAYAWWMESSGQQPWAWIVLDLCLMSVGSAADLVREISRRTALPTDRIFVSTTHTHSAPDVHHISRSSEPWAKRYYSLLIEACSDAVNNARRRARPSRIEVRIAGSDLGVNRRDVSRPSTGGY
jgi:hypothetical protein